MAMKYYYDLMSQPCRALYMFLKMNNIQFTPKLVHIRKGENRTPEFKAMNPMGRLPVIDDNGFILTESVAILQYLCDKHNVPNHWFPKDLQKRAMVNEFMNWQHFSLRWNGSMVFQTKVVIPRMTGEPVKQDKLQRFTRQLEESLDNIEEYFLKDRPYVGGNDISVADLLCICELMQPTIAGFQFGQNRHKLLSYIKRVTEKTNPYFDEAHVFAFKLRDMQAGQSNL